MRPVLMIFLGTALICRAEEPLAGRWSGKIQIPERELTLIVDLAQENQKWTGSAIIPGLNVKGSALADIALQGSEVTFAIAGMSSSPGGEPPKVKAHLADGKLTGDFLQAGNSARLVLEKIGPPEVEHALPSTAVAKEFEGEWKGGYSLLGFPRKVSLKLQNHGADPATAEFVIAGRKVNNVPVDRITQHGDFITIESSAFGMTYEGRLRNNEIKGTLFQGPIEVGFVLQRPK